MSFSVIAYIAPNYRDYKNYWLKAYEPGTTTPKSMATDSTLSVLIAKAEINKDGFIESAGGALIIPYIDGAYDLWLFPTEAEADANDTINAERVADNITGTISSTDISENYTQFGALSSFVNDANLAVGMAVRVTDRDNYIFNVVSGQTPNGTDIVDATASGFQLQVQYSASMSVAALGGVGDLGVTDDTAAVLRAFELMQAIYGEVDLLDKTWRYTSPIIISSPITVKGAVNGVQNTGDTKGAILLKDGDFLGIEIISAAHPTLRDFALLGAPGNGGQGLKITSGGRFNLHRFTSANHNLQNIEFNSGNLSSWVNVIVLGSVTSSGLWVNGAAAPDTNAIHFDIDARENASFGVHLDNCWNSTGYFKTQSNGTGIRMNNVRQSSFSIYSESNSTTDIEITSDSNFEGNLLNFLFYGTFTDNQSKPKENMIMRALEGSDTRAIYDYMNAKRFQMPTIAGLAGSMSIEHPSDAKFSQYFESTGQGQELELRNTANLVDREADDPIFPINLNVNGAVYSERKIFTNLDTTPDISLSSFWLSNNTNGTVVTTFTGGVRGMSFTVVENTGNMTITHTPYPGQGISLKGGVSRALVIGEAVDFIQSGATQWIEK